MTAFRHLFTAAAMAAGLITAPGFAQDGAAPKRGGVAILALGSETSMPNAVMSIAPADVVPACMVYEGLVVVAADGTVLPGLAESWDVSNDGRSYTFHLREAKFHNGTPLTSEDVVFTLTEVTLPLHPTVGLALRSVVSSIDAPDPRTVIIRLRQPYGPLLRSLTCSLSGGILSAKLYRATNYRDNPVTTQAPVGTGPFVLSEWTRGDSIRLDRNSDYWDPEKPYLDSIILRFMGNAGTRVQALLAGEVDYVSSSQFPANSYGVFRDNKDFQLQRTGWSPNMLYAFFNLDRPPLNDPRVRHALLVATDRDYIFKNAFYGLGQQATAPWTVRIPWAMPSDVNYNAEHAFDTARAAQMLEEAGYPADANGVRFEVTVNYNNTVPERHQAASALQATWRKAGVVLKLEPLENAVLLPRVHQEGKFDLYISSYNSFGDPAIGVAPAFVSSAIGANFGNAAGYRNPEVDALFEQGAQGVSLEDRAKAYHQIARIIMRDLPAITLHENHGFDVATSRLHDAWGTYGFGQWGNAWLDD